MLNRDRRAPILGRQVLLGATVFALWGAFTLIGPGNRQPGLLSSHGRLQALPANDDPRLDPDGDLLPNHLEWILLSDPHRPDSDSDGISDFIEAVTYTSPVMANKAGNAQDSFRLLTSTTIEIGTRKRSLWVTLLFRFPSGQITDLSGLNLFLDQNGSRADLTPLLFSFPTEVETRKVQGQGLLVRISLKIPDPGFFAKITPFTIGSYARINHRFLTAGSPMFTLGSSFHTFALFAPGRMILQSSGQGEMGSPFWTTGKACVLTLQVLGLTPGWKVCEIKKADCEVTFRGQCSPDCKRSVGTMVLVPDGLPLVEGG